MRKLAPFLLAAGLVFAASASAVAAPPSSDPATAATYAATWLAHQVNDDGFIPSSFVPGTADLSSSVQAVTALAAAGVGRAQVDALLTYLGAHVNDFVVIGGSDHSAELAYLILASVAGGVDPTAFGTPPTNLVARLQATQQPSGLFGSSSPGFDGAYRQGFSLLALKAVGLSNQAAVAWLEDQQCADGSWVPFRAAPLTACPPIDPVNFTGPDTNSTAVAVLGLQAHNATGAAAAGVAALEAVRTADGGWGFFAGPGQQTDANSTALVLDAFRAVNGARDANGTAALLALQVGCDADPADQGGIAFQPGSDGSLVPNSFATVQATPALAGVVLPIGEAAIADAVPDPCAPPATSTTSTTSTTLAVPPTTVRVAAVTTTAPAMSAPTTVRVTATAGGELPRTGADASGLVALGALLTIIGGAGGIIARSSRRVRGST